MVIFFLWDLYSCPARKNFVFSTKLLLLVVHSEWLHVIKKPYSAVDMVTRMWVFAASQRTDLLLWAPRPLGWKEAASSHRGFEDVLTASTVLAPIFVPLPASPPVHLRNWAGVPVMRWEPRFCFYGAHFLGGRGAAAAAAGRAGGRGKTLAAGWTLEKANSKPGSLQRSFSTELCPPTES